MAERVELLEKLVREIESLSKLEREILLRVIALREARQHG